MITPDATPELMLPKGVKDFLPVKAAKIEYLKQTLAELFARWGFRPIIPASLEYLDVLERGLGAGLREKTFRFDDRQSGRLVTFSPDITPQVARIVATRMHQMPLPLRLSYGGQVLRHAEQQAGKDREIFQAGVELIGLASPEADAEMIAMAVESLQTLGAGEFTIDIGQVEFFRGVMADLPLSTEQARQIEAAIACKDSSGLQRQLEDLPLSDGAREEVLALPRLFGGHEVLAKASRVVRNDRSRRALDNLVRILEILSVYQVQEFVTFDLGELRGLDYHSGVTFQGYLTGFGRAVCSGGRYDGLTARYGFPAPATGFTFNLLNLLFALERELDTVARRSTDVLIFQAGSDKSAAQRLARALRSRGYSVARDIIPRDLAATLEYARAMSYRWLMALQEGGNNLVLYRLADGEQRPLTLAEVLDGAFTL